MGKEPFQFYGEKELKIKAKKKAKKMGLSLSAYLRLLVINDTKED